MLPQEEQVLPRVLPHEEEARSSIDIVAGMPPEEWLFLILTSAHLLNKVRI
jgi:hypothetical protein